MLGLVTTAVLLVRQSGQSPATGLAGEQRPFVTWPSEEKSSRASPDGRWVAFLSDRDGRSELFVKPTAGGDATKIILPAGTVESCAWSPDGSELACAVRLPDGVFLQIIPAPTGGVIRKSIRLEAASLQVLKWIGVGIFVQVDRRPTVLQRVDSRLETATDLSTQWTLPEIDGRAGMFRGFDVSPDGKQVVMAVSAGDREDLWIAGLDGSAMRPLTATEHFERRPIWAGRDTVVFQSNRGGQIDIWAISTTDARSWPLTTGRTTEIPESASADGALITFQLIDETAHLWLRPAPDKSRPTATLEPVTSDTLADLSPSVSADGGVVAFQRALESPREGYGPLDGRVMVGILQDRALVTQTEALDTGYAPLLSPDSAHVAFVGPTQSKPSLRLKTLSTKATDLVTDALLASGASLFPTDWTSQPFAWAPDSSQLFFLQRAPGAAIRSYRPGTGVDPSPVVAAREGERLRDVYPSSDGRQLAYLAVSRAGIELRVVDLSTRQSSALRRWETGELVSCRGWTSNDQAVVVISQKEAAIPPATIELETVATTGQRHPAHRIDGVYYSSVRVDARQSLVYMTRLEGSSQNLFALSLISGSLERLTENRLSTISFSGVRPRPDGSLVFAIEDKKQDIHVHVARTSPAPGTK